MEWAQLLLLLPLGFIIFEDFRYRAIHWIWIILLIGFIFYFHKISLTHSLTNLSLLAIQFLCLTFYFSIREKKVSNIINRYIGIGDFLFLVPVCFLFSPLNLMLFLSIGYGLTLLGTWVAFRLSSNNTLTIPLAGSLSIVLIIVLVGFQFYGFALNDDYLVFYLIHFREI
jgi:hypothetical protein